jgi:hypothetical protein
MLDDQPPIAVVVRPETVRVRAMVGTVPVVISGATDVPMSGAEANVLVDLLAPYAKLAEPLTDGSPVLFQLAKWVAVHADAWSIYWPF